MASEKPASDLQSSSLERQDYMQSPRTPHLLRLWAEICLIEQLPQMDRWLAQRFRNEKRFGKKDRRWYADAVFQALRWGPWAIACETLLAAAGSPQSLAPLLSSRTEPEAWWSLLRGLPGERLFFWLSLRLEVGARVQAAATPGESAVLAMWPSLKQSAEGLLLSEGIPPFFAAAWKSQQQRGTWSAAEGAQFLQQQSLRPPLWLRLTLPDKEEEFSRELAAHGSRWRQEEESFALLSEGSIKEWPAYEKGWIEIQDRASQQIGASVPVKDDALIWDCCAGGGGKTLQLASRLGRHGRVYASDVRQYKLEELRQRATRAHLQNIQALSWEGQKLPSWPADVSSNRGFDLVLVDAPCSSSGTWRRNPDAKLKLTQHTLLELTALQDHILDTVSPAVKAGGYLAYATCSWLPVENEDRVAAFLAKHRDFQSVSAQLFGCPKSDSDTMFVSVLQRRL